MKVDQMRFIDKWAGIPLSLLMTIVLFPIDFLRGRKPKQPKIQRTLLIELSEMGSAILVDPAMRKLRKEGGADLYFVIFKRNAASLDLLKTVPTEHIFLMDASNLLTMSTEIIRFFFWCRKNKITCVVDLELFSRFTAILSGLSGARSRVGFASLHDEGLYRGGLINFPVRYNPHVHISVNFVSLVNTCLGLHDTAYSTTAVGADELELQRAEITIEEKEHVLDLLAAKYPDVRSKRIVLLNVNASDLLPQRRWMPERFAEVGKRLLDNFDDVLIVLTGAPGEMEYVGKVAEMIGHDRCVNAAGMFQFSELVPLYYVSTLMLTNDSGPAHFASVTDLKVYVIFGPETPALYGSLGNSENFYLGLPCSPCVSAANHRKTTCTTRPCVSGISTEWVSHTLTDYLAGSESTSSVA